MQAQYVKFRNGLSAILRKQLGPNAILIANTAGAGDDPNLNGITLEMEACIDPTECIKWLKDQEKIGAQPAMSIIWTCDGKLQKHTRTHTHAHARTPQHTHTTHHNTRARTHTHIHIHVHIRTHIHIHIHSTTHAHTNAHKGHSTTCQNLKLVPDTSSLSVILV